MAGSSLKRAAMFLYFLNWCMYVILIGTGLWAMNKAIDLGFIKGAGNNLPTHFAPIYFPMGNAATGSFVMFALIAGIVGLGSVPSSNNNLQLWNKESLAAATSAAVLAWEFTLVALSFAAKEIKLEKRNATLKAMEAFVIILSATQWMYLIVIYVASLQQS